MDPKLISLPKFLDIRGNLSFIEEETHLPFRIKRVYWIYDVPGGERRGGHAFKKNMEVIVALSGSFEVIFHNGLTESRFALNRSYYGLYVPNMIWRTLDNFSTNSLALIISSAGYSEKDYIRNFDEFLEAARQ